MQEVMFQYLYRFFLALCVVSFALWVGLMGMAPLGLKVAYTSEGDLVLARSVSEPTQGATGVFSDVGAEGAVTTRRIDGALRKDGQLQYYSSDASGVIREVYLAQTFQGSAYAVIPLAGLLARMVSHPVGAAACMGAPLVMLVVQGLQSLYTRRDFFSTLSKRFAQHYSGARS